MMRIFFFFSTLCLLPILFCLSDSYIEAETTRLHPHADKANDDFYGVIIKNNLFRPLGWRPPRRVIPYRLLATITYPPAAKRSPTAILVEKAASEKTHYVRMGDKIGETLVVKIVPKQVTLHVEGKEVVLRVNVGYLNTSGQKWRAPAPTLIHSDPTKQKIFIPPHTTKLPAGF